MTLTKRQLYGGPSGRQTRSVISSPVIFVRLRSGPSGATATPSAAI